MYYYSSLRAVTLLLNALLEHHNVYAVHSTPYALDLHLNIRVVESSGLLTLLAVWLLRLDSNQWNEGFKVPCLTAWQLSSECNICVLLQLLFYYKFLVLYIDIIHKLMPHFYRLFDEMSRKLNVMLKKSNLRLNLLY